MKCSWCGKTYPELVGEVCQNCLYGSGVFGKAEDEQRQSWNSLVTPKDFDTYIGQIPIKTELKTMLKATKIHKIPIQHCLFSGGFGLGKTTIAKIFASQVEPYEIVTGTTLKTAEDMPEQRLVIIDEIHTLANTEWVLGLMDRGEKIIFGTTTTAGTLSGPLRSRFISFTLEPYKVSELAEIVKGAAKNLNYKCPDFVATEVAKRGKTVARVALFLFKRVYDRIILEKKSVTPQKLAEWFTEMQIDENGLDNADRAYIACLSDKPVGLQYLTAMTGFDRITLEEAIEPFLMTHGFIKRTPTGRILGDKVKTAIWTI